MAFTNDQYSLMISMLCVLIQKSLVNIRFTKNSSLRA